MKKALVVAAVVLTASLGLWLLWAPHVHADIQYPLCNKGCVTSYRSYTIWSSTTSSLSPDNTRQGVNPFETQLTPSIVSNSNSFRSRNSVFVDGQIYAQPLYMSGLPFGLLASENGVFVATEHGSIYLFEAYTLRQVKMLSLLPSGDVAVPQGELPADPGNMNLPCANITAEVGITGTPVIDPAPPSNTVNPANSDPVLFAIVKSKHSSNNYHQTLQAWDPVTNSILASLDMNDATNGLGWSSSNALFQNQRAGLALAHDSQGAAIIYVAWGSHCDSQVNGTFRGWAAAFKYDYTKSSSNFSKLAVFTDEDPAHNRGGIWMGGAAPAIDDNTGDVYLATGNGDATVTANPPRLGESIVRFTSPLTAAGAYTPNKWVKLNLGTNPNETVALPAPASPNAVQLPNDQDLGAGGAVLLKPVSQGRLNTKGFVVFAAGKEGVGYVLDPTQMTSITGAVDGNDPCTPGTQLLQCFQPINLLIQTGTTNVVVDGSGGRADYVFWGGDTSNGKTVVENTLITAGSQDVQLRYWNMPIGSTAKGTFNTTMLGFLKAPPHGNGNSFPYPGGSTLVTWNDTVQNPPVSDAIAWVLDSSQFAPLGGSGSPAVLLAYYAIPSLATNGQWIFIDSANGPIANKFTVPVVVNGQVYVGGQGTSTQCTANGQGSNCGMLVRWSQ